MAKVALSRRLNLEYWAATARSCLRREVPLDLVLAPILLAANPPAGRPGGHADGDGLLVVAFRDGAGMRRARKLLRRSPSAASAQLKTYIGVHGHPLWTSGVVEVGGQLGGQPR
jgi:hypothetical protein